MSDKKIIIRNCPALYSGEYCKENTYEDGSIYCQGTDCIMKQIVELCNDDLKPIREWQEGNTIFVEYKKDAHLARDIIQLLDIQEVE